MAASKRGNSSTGIAAEPLNASRSVETSASTGRCISAEAAVGTVIRKLTR